MNRITLKFIADMDPYRKGEIASFPPAQAEAIIARGYAVKVMTSRQEDVARLKHIAEPPQTRHIPGPESTKSKRTYTRKKK